MIDPRTSLRELHKAAKGVVDSIANTPESFEAYRKLGIEVGKLDDEFMHQIPDELCQPADTPHVHAKDRPDISHIGTGDTVAVMFDGLPHKIEGRVETCVPKSSWLRVKQGGIVGGKVNEVLRWEKAGV